MSINISGAVDFRVIDYDGRRFVLFSDIHSTFEGLCPEECITSNSPNVNEQLAESACYTVDGAIKKIILEADKRGEYVDIFLESNFYGTPPHRILLIDPVDPLDVTVRAYRDCLYNRSICPYKNARFHYIDIRQGISKGTTYLGVIPNIMDLVRRVNKSPLFNRTLPIESLGGNINDYLTFFVNSYVLRLFISSDTLANSHLWLFVKILLESNNYINETTDFLNKILIINTKMADRFSLALSKIFPLISLDHIRSLLYKLLEYTIKKVKAWSLEPTMIVTRDNSTISRIKAQLVGLKNQGDSSLAESLQEYIYTKIQTVSLLQLYKLLRLQYQHILAYIELIATNSNDTTLISNHVSFLQKKLPENPVLHIASFTMDLYTIARMLRRFGPQHIISSYVIAYEGKAHINTISEYLQLIGSTPIIYNPLNDNKRCIGIPNANLFRIV